MLDLPRAWTVHHGDAAAVLAALPEGSVHCCVTSPPYWGLRDYGVEGQIGLEKTPEAWVERLVAVFAEVRRVLRDDGTLWLVVGDAYCGAPPGNDRPGYTGPTRDRGGIKPKDLLGLPWMLAFALRADGWWLRSEVIWHKRACLPESVEDRPTRCHEQVFLLAKSARYYYDAEAVREPAAPESAARYAYGFGGPKNVEHHRQDAEEAAGCRTRPIGAREQDGTRNGTRNKRTVWSLAPEPFAGAHFATFPTKLVEPCVLAGTSARGACAACGAPLARVIEKGGADEEHQAACGGDAAGEYHGTSTKGHAAGGVQDASAVKARILAGMLTRRTTGWEPTCACGPAAGVVPCVVLDPFVGSGTTGVVARRRGRDFVGIELNPEYCAMARRRIEASANDHQMALFP